MEKNIRIVKASVSDLKTLQKIGKQTFIETFAYSNSDEDMQKYLQQNFSEEQLTQELNNPNSAFYFAILDDKTVGYLKINWSKAQTEQHDMQALELERIYVLNGFQGKNIGQLLHDKTLSIAKTQKSKYLWLGVWEHNSKAIRFYEKNGFIAFDKHIFIVGVDKQTDILMKLML